MKKILFIVKNEHEASSRFRVFSYFTYLQEDFLVDTFFAEYNMKLPKIFHSLIKRLRFLSIILNAKKYDILFMQRPMSSDRKRSTFFEKLLSIANPNLIFDFDDALFIQNEEKIISLIRLSKIIICGNQYLANFAMQYNKNTYIVPTTIDTTKFQPLLQCNKPIITIGWTGTSGNYANFTHQLIEALKSILSIHTNVRFLFICDQRPPKHFDFPYEFIQWNSETEVTDLQKIDIGIMPLINSSWTRGKCGFKLIQYGSIGIASIGSDVGINNKILIDGKSGFLIRNENEWLQKIETLITDKNLRYDMGKNAQQKIQQDYDTFKTYTKLKTILTSLYEPQ